MAKKMMPKAAKGASDTVKPKFGSPEWQAKHGKGKAKINAQKKLGKP